jgi:hypothetical protein
MGPNDIEELNNKNIKVAKDTLDIVRQVKEVLANKPEMKKCSGCGGMTPVPTKDQVERLKALLPKLEFRDADSDPVCLGCVVRSLRR